MKFLIPLIYLLQLCFSASTYADILPVRTNAYSYNQKLNSEIFLDHFNALIDELKFPINGVEVNDRCLKYMNEKLVLGSLGQFIFDEIVQNGKIKYPELLEASSLKRYCPNYSSMDINSRAQVITVLLATMAHFESSCNQYSTNKNGPNGLAIGLYQLHKNHEDVYDGNAKYCLKNSGYDSKNSSICTLSMLNLQIKNRSGELFTQKSYWDVLRPQGHAGSAPQLIKLSIQKLPLCN